MSNRLPNLFPDDAGTNAIETAVSEHLRKFTTAPYLFVGSGLSRRFLGLDNWEGLLRKLASLTGRDYAYFRATASSDFPATATAIAGSLHERWWNEGQFEASRDEFAEIADSPEFCLKVEAAKLVSHAANYDDLPQNLDEEVRLLQKCVVDGVITTNWDLLMEEIFPDFKVYVGQEELLFRPIQGIGEIYKIHGCCTHPDSLVVTRADYDRFHERNAYLAAKLLTLFVEHPVIFLGYSLSDPNITAIIRSIAIGLTNKNIGQLRDRLMFVQWVGDPDAESIESSNIVTDGFNIPVLSIRTHSFAPVFRALTSVPRRFPARILRQLKEHVYELVKTNDPHGRLFVQDLDSEDGLDEVDVVLGVGAISEFGYRAVTRDDLVYDVLYEDKGFDAASIVSDTLPRILKQAKYAPSSNISDWPAS